MERPIGACSNVALALGVAHFTENSNGSVP